LSFDRLYFSSRLPIVAILVAGGLGTWVAVAQVVPPSLIKLVAWSPILLVAVLLALNRALRHSIPGALDKYGLPAQLSARLDRQRPWTVHLIRLTELVSYFAISFAVSFAMLLPNG
jgi:hypothetical protein